MMWMLSDEIVIEIMFKAVKWAQWNHILLKIVVAEIVYPTEYKQGRAEYMSNIITTTKP